MQNNQAISERTPTKHNHFKALFAMHTDIARNTILRWSWRPGVYQYIDLNAGAGRVIYEDGTQGTTSGLRAVIRLSSLQEQEPPLIYHAHLIDNYAPNCEALRAHYDIRDNPDVTVYCGDNREVIQTISIPRGSLGLVSSDSNTLMGDLPIFDALAARPEFYRMDFLIYLSASNYKRDRRANDREFLTDRLFRLKPYWYVQEPYDKHQKAFLLGSRWDNFKKWQSLKFAPVQTEIGREYLERINLTEKERFLAHQAGLPIAPMRNTSGIPASEPCAPKRLSVAVVSVSDAEPDP
jgi:hypothetical protein